MRSRVAIVVGAILVGIGPSLDAPALADASPAGGPVRIMVNGDSISQGFDGDVNWRYRLWQEFRRQRVSVDMVGPFDTPHLTPGWRTTSYAQSGWDSDHAALGGSLLASWASTIGDQVRRARPDVIVLEAGLNDLRHGATPAKVLGSFRDYVSRARAAEPDLRFIVSPVLASRESANRALETRIAAYDALLRSEVPKLTTASSPVVLAATTTGWSVPGMTWDGTHPNPVGETFLAQRFAQALAASRAVPGFGAPAIRTVRVWERRPPVQVVIRRGRALVSWDTERSTGARIWIKRAGHAAKVMHVHRASPGLRVRSRKLVAGATYGVRVSIERRAMVTPYGAVTRVVVPGRRVRHHG